MNESKKNTPEARQKWLESVAREKAASPDSEDKTEHTSEQHAHQTSTQETYTSNKRIVK